MKHYQIAVVYHTATGTTEQLAHAVVEGIESVTFAEALVIKIIGADIAEGRFVNEEILKALNHTDAMIFGSPTLMGCVSAQFKAFADATSDLWMESKWAGKIAAGFTIGSNLSGDQLNTIQYLNIFAGQHGMLWAGIDILAGYDPQGRNRLGAQGGLIAHTNDLTVHPTDLETAHYLGARVARITKQFGENET